MAVLARCLLCSPAVGATSAPSEPPHHRHVALSVRINGAPSRPVYDAKFQSQPAKVPISFGKLSMKLEGPVQSTKMFSSCCSLSTASGLLQHLKSKPVSRALRSTFDCTCDNGNNGHHQTLVTTPALLKSLFAVNALTLMLPLEALAETCENSNSLFNMPLLFAIAMIGATVGGLLARQRRGELARLNEQLRQINAALRRQAKIESYAPTLSYAPTTKVAEAEVVVDPRKDQLLTRLRTGKNFLRNQNPEKAFYEFKAAFEIAQTLGDHVNEKKAARGLGASLQRQGNYREAIKYHSKVLEISKRAGEESGSTEAYGAIADCYTELGDLERAGKFYDKYIARLESD